jgi:hypothetical protein
MDVTGTPVGAGLLLLAFSLSELPQIHVPTFSTSLGLMCHTPTVVLCRTVHLLLLVVKQKTSREGWFLVIFS